LTEKDFTIDRVSWHSRVPGNPETFEQMVKRFFAIAVFLQKHHLTKRVLATREEDITEEFVIHSSDLTVRGLLVLRAAYDRWQTRVSRGADPADTTVLEQALRRIDADFDS
jgi:hypothetical protein